MSMAFFAVLQTLKLHINEQKYPSSKWTGRILKPLNIVFISVFFPNLECKKYKEAIAQMKAVHRQMRYTFFSKT